MRQLPEIVDAIEKGARILTICNACRYCEGYCAVFPALELRTTFAAADLNYLANLCHNCGECYYACQYAPPHEFGVNVPKTLAEIRLRSYRQYARPGFFGGSFLFVAILVLAALTIWVALAGSPVSSGQFYRVIRHRTMVAIFGAVSIIVVAALVAGLVRFWRESGDGPPNLVAFKAALNDTLRLRYLHGDGEGCTYPDAERSRAQWWCHHFTFYGFLLCFAATCLAALYHYAFGWIAPYGYLSLPVMLGTIGGIGLLVGPAGLLWLKNNQDPATRDANQTETDISFIVLLFLTSATGLLLLGLRQTSAMKLLLVIHLGTVLALFITLPYGKFVHGIYRLAALMRYALERSRAKV